MKEAGEEGGAMKAGFIALVVAWLVKTPPLGCEAEALPPHSGMREEAGTICFRAFWDLKHDKTPKQPLHFFLCKRAHTV